jgi:hypothetical protein
MSLTIGIDKTNAGEGGGGQQQQTISNNTRLKETVTDANRSFKLFQIDRAVLVMQSLSICCAWHCKPPTYIIEEQK